MGLLRRLRRFFGLSEPIAWVSEAKIVAAFRRLDRELRQELREIAEQVRATEAVAYLVFDFRVFAVWDEFPFTVYTFDAEGRDCGCPANERGLLPGRHLLGPEGRYPLGRVDWIGVDTTLDAELVDRVCMQQFREQWARVGAELPGVQVLVGPWSDTIAWAEGNRPSIEMLDIATGEVRVITWYTLD